MHRESHDREGGEHGIDRAVLEPEVAEVGSGKQPTRRSNSRHGLELGPERGELVADRLEELRQGELARDRERRLPGTSERAPTQAPAIQSRRDRASRNVWNVPP